MSPRALLGLAFIPSALFAATPPSAGPAAPQDGALAESFTRGVRPFVQTYCVSCHGKDKPEAELDLTPYPTVQSVIEGFGHWEIVLERLEAAEMPPDDEEKQPSAKERAEIIAWIHALRESEANKNAGDPGPVLARRLNNAEYDYTIRDLTGVDIRPTRAFPVDPANQAGFDNSGESLSMSPALVKKYLGAAREVADHLILQPEGFTFAPHPVVADTDRDKYFVLKIVDFYRRQPTDLADYFAAAWRYQHRAVLGQPDASLARVAVEAKISPHYLETVWRVLSDGKDDVGPIAKLRQMWRDQSSPRDHDAVAASRARAEAMRDYVNGLRVKLVPDVRNLSAPQIQGGSQTFVMWKNRQMAANRRKFDPGALQVDGVALVEPPPPMPDRGGRQKAKGGGQAAAQTAATTPANQGYAGTKTGQAPRPAFNDAIIQRGGTFLAPTIVTKDSSATARMAAARRRGVDPELNVPSDPVERARYEAAFARFADVFPDAFFITERARVYLDAEREQNNAGRLLSAGLHSMTGYFRDDGPLYDLVLDDAGRRELDGLWRQFFFSASVPHRMHTSFVWFERTDSSFMRDEEFNPYRPENKAVTEQAMIKSLAEVYLAKAGRNNAGPEAQEAIKEHFEIVAATIRRVEEDRIAAEPSHLKAIEQFAERAFRRPLSAAERDGLRRFYRAAREENGLDHENAVRDCIASILMSPHFCYRIDLVEAAGGPVQTRNATSGVGAAKIATADLTVPANALPLSDYALASRLSYFLWSSMPDAELLARAAAGELQKRETLVAQARRMLKDPRARNFVTEFSGHWLDFRRFEEHNAVDRERFPSFDNDLRQAMFEEPIRFLLDLVQRDGPVLDLLYGDHTFVNAALAKHYGMPLPASLSDDGWGRVERAGEYDRGGLLPMSVFLTANSPGLRTSPVKRGYWVVRRVLGERIPPPPPTVPELPGDEKDLGELTLREVLARHRSDKACSSCHERFDSFGLAFEGFGAIGERRAKDFGGRPVDAHAEFPGGKQGTGFAGLREYVRENREKDFVDNLCRKLVAYALGRTPLMSDDKLVAEMKTQLAANDHRFTTLVEAIVASPQFRTKRASTIPPSVKTAALP